MTFAAPPTSDLVPCAVAWIDEQHAIVACMSGQGDVSTCGDQTGLGARVRGTSISWSGRSAIDSAS